MSAETIRHWATGIVIVWFLWVWANRGRKL